MYKVLILSVLLSITGLAHADTWEYFPKLDPITDANRSAVIKLDTTRTMSLAVRCMSDGLNIQLATNKYLGDTELFGLWRIDNQDAVPTVFDISVDKESVFFEMNITHLVVDLMISGTSMAVRVYGDSGAETTAVFSLMGFHHQYKKLKCNVGI